MKAIFLCDNTGNIGRVYGAEGIGRASACHEFLTEKVVTGAELASCGGRYRQTELVFSTWGMPTLEEEEISKKLLDFRADIFHAVGHVLHAHCVVPTQAVLQLLGLFPIKASLLSQPVDKINVAQTNCELLDACGLQSLGGQHDDLGVSGGAAGSQKLHAGLLELALTARLNLFITIQIGQIAEALNLLAAT